MHLLYLFTHAYLKYMAPIQCAFPVITESLGSTRLEVKQIIPIPSQVRSVDYYVDFFEVLFQESGLVSVLLHTSLLFNIQWVFYKFKVRMHTYILMNQQHIAFNKITYHNWISCTEHIEKQEMEVKWKLEMLL